MSDRSRLRRLLAAATAGLLLPTTIGVSGAGATDGADHTKYDRVVDITFPVGGSNHYVQSYDAGRGGNTDECTAQGVSGRVHQAVDIMADKMLPVYAAQSGVVRWAPETEPSYGWMISIDGDDGLEYSYVHLNNDTPGTDDGKGGIDRAYAPGVRRGARVERGQHIGWVGDSGNAEWVAPQLHFEIEDPQLDDPRLECPYQAKRMDPYPSLQAAQNQGDVPPATPPAGGGSYNGIAEPWIFDDVPPTGTHADSIEALVDAGVTSGCAVENSFCPNDEVKRSQMATFIRQAMDLVETQSTSQIVEELADVPADNVHAGSIATLLERQIATLCDTDRFCPADALTRADMAVWLANALGLTDGETSFTDVPLDAPYAEAVAAIADLGITTGCDGDGLRFCPDDPVSRGQMATFLKKAFLDG